MRQFTTLMATAALAGLTIAGCDRQPATPPARPLAPAAPAAPAATKAATPATAAAERTTARTASLATATSVTHGRYLTDGAGRALYLLEEDGQGPSRCYQMCVVVWPPYLAGSGQPVAGDSAIRPALLGTRPRENGPPQVAYAGRPLYYYIGDDGPGRTRGHHVEDSWGEWRLVHPSGASVRGERERIDGRDERERRRRREDR